MQHFQAFIFFQSAYKYALFSRLTIYRSKQHKDWECVKQEKYVFTVNVLPFKEAHACKHMQWESLLPKQWTYCSSFEIEGKKVAEGKVFRWCDLRQCKYLSVKSKRKSQPRKKIEAKRKLYELLHTSAGCFGLDRIFKDHLLSSNPPTADRENTSSNTEQWEQSVAVNKRIDPNRTTSKIKAISTMVQQNFLSAFKVLGLVMQYFFIIFHRSVKTSSVKQ